MPKIIEEGWEPLSVGCIYEDDLDDMIKQLGDKSYKMVEHEGLFYVLIPKIRKRS